MFYNAPIHVLLLFSFFFQLLFLLHHLLLFLVPFFMGGFSWVQAVLDDPGRLI